MSDYLRDITIMVVEDQEFTANLLRKMLRVLGASDVHLFDNGEDAWNYYRSNPVDLVITDWQMSPVNGIKLAQLIRKNPESPNTFVPIIMVTAFREREHVFKARDAGVTEFCCKPITAKEMFSKIAAVINEPRPFIRNRSYFGPDRRRADPDTATFKGPERRKSRLKAAAKAEEAATGGDSDANVA